MTRQVQIALKYGLPLLILAAAAGLTFLLFSAREEPERKDIDEKPTLVETTTVERDAHRLDVRASGTVVPARQIVVSPQVSGRLTSVDDDLVPGGIVEDGETIAEIERDDYRIAVKQRETALKQAKSQLAIEQGQQDVARQEWQLFKDDVSEEGSSEESTGPPALALRKPQLESAKAQVEAAEAQLEQAQLNLRRTNVQAPFDALVRSEQADLGQLVGAQSQLATLVGIERFWVRLSVPSDEIPLVDIPGVNATEGSIAHITYDVGPKSITRKGRVVRLLGDLDPQGRMARVLVEIDDPLGVLANRKSPETDQRGIPLLLDAFVDVRLEGNTTQKLIEIPRQALRNGDEAYVIEDGQLSIRPLEIVQRLPDSVLVGEGLEDGDTLVTGPLPKPVEGMKLRPSDSKDEDAAHD
jgi:RND family efflux transporter MFP subunit